MLSGSVLIQKIMSGLNLPPDSVAKMILLQKNLYDSGTSPQDIVQLLQMVSENQQANLVAMSSDLKLAENLTETDLESICDLIDATSILQFVNLAISRRNFPISWNMFDLKIKIVGIENLAKSVQLYSCRGR